MGQPQQPTSCLEERGKKKSFSKIQSNIQEQPKKEPCRKELGDSEGRQSFPKSLDKGNKTPCLCQVQGNNASPPGSDCREQLFLEPYSSSKLSSTTWHSLSCSSGLLLATKLITPSALRKYPIYSSEAKLVLEGWLSPDFPFQALRGCSAIRL